MKDRDLEHQRRPRPAGERHGWLKDAAPDILCLQEIKCEDAAFPAEAFEELGYNVATHGQKGFNGVALLSKLPLRRGLARPSRRRQRRSGPLHRGGGLGRRHDALRVASLYLPNGNPVGSEKFPYKLAWMERLDAHARAPSQPRKSRSCSPATTTSFPSRRTPRYPENWLNDALFQPETPRRLPRASEPRPDRRLARLRRPAATTTRSGTIRPAPGRRTTASASTTCCCRRRRPTGWSSRGDRQAHARLGKAVRPRAGDHRPRFLAACPFAAL